MTPTMAQEPIYQPVAAAPRVESIARQPTPTQKSAIAPVTATIDARLKPAPKPLVPVPRQSELLKFIQDEEK